MAKNTFKQLVDEAYGRLEIACVGMDAAQMLAQKETILSNPELTSRESLAAFNRMIKKKMAAERRAAAITKILELAGENFEGCEIEMAAELNLVSITYPKKAEIERV